MGIRKSAIASFLVLGLIQAEAVFAHEPIYRWISPSGVVSFGDRPPPGARDLRRVHTAPAPPPGPSIPTVATESSEEASAAPSAALAREEALIARLDLLTALANYARTREPPSHPPHSVYSPTFLLPPAYGYLPGRALAPAPPPPPPGIGPRARRSPFPPWASPPPSAGPAAPQHPLWASP